MRVRCCLPLLVLLLLPPSAWAGSLTVVVQRDVGGKLRPLAGAAVSCEATERFGPPIQRGGEEWDHGDASLVNGQLVGRYWEGVALTDARGRVTFSDGPDAAARAAGYTIDEEGPLWPTAGHGYVCVASPPGQEEDWEQAGFGRILHRGGSSTLRIELGREPRNAKVLSGQVLYWERGVLAPAAGGEVSLEPVAPLRGPAPEQLSSNFDFRYGLTLELDEDGRVTAPLRDGWGFPLQPGWRYRLSRRAPGWPAERSFVDYRGGDLDISGEIGPWPSVGIAVERPDGPAAGRWPMTQIVLRPTDQVFDWGCGKRVGLALVPDDQLREIRWLSDDCSFEEGGIAPGTYLLEARETGFRVFRAHIVIDEQYREYTAVLEPRVPHEDFDRSDGVRPGAGRLLHEAGALPRRDGR